MAAMAAESSPGAALPAAAADAAPAAPPAGLVMDEILVTIGGASIATDGDKELCRSHLQMLSITAYQYLCHFWHLYGTQFLVLAVLVGLAAYRREMSCNRVFHDMEGAAERRGSAAVNAWTKPEEEEGEEDDNASSDDDDDAGDGNDGDGRRRCKREKNPANPRRQASDDEIDDLLDGAALLSRPLVAMWDVAADTAKGMELVASSGSASSSSRDGGTAGAAAVTSGMIDVPSHQRSGKTKSGPAVAAIMPPAPQTSPLLHLSPDTIVHILIYLHPRDITMGFACAAKATRSLVDDELSTGLINVAGNDYPNAMPRRSSSHSVSVMLWKQLWWRDYGHTLSRWDIGRQAMKRSVGARIDGDGDGDTRNRKPIGNPAFRHLESSLTGAKICEDAEDDGTHGRRSSLPPAQKKGQLKDDSDYGNNHSGDNSGGAVVDFLSSRSRSTMKNLYFSFAACWVDYTLAGQNTLERCLVGLHGNVFDISDFVESHPGSPETLLVQAGRDATSFFEDLGHSLGARRIALSMCAVMDRSCAEQRLTSNATHWSVSAAPRGSSCGLCLPAGGNGAVPKRSDVAASRALAVYATGSVPMGRSKPRRVGCLQRILEDLHKGKVKAQVCADKWAASVGNGTALEGGMLGSVRVYWDPLRGEWLAWYTNHAFQPVYLASDVTRYGK
jgi:cytochrome b involved in lipid metabolism